MRNISLLNNTTRPMDERLDTTGVVLHVGTIFNVTLLGYYHRQIHNYMSLFVACQVNSCRV